MNSENKNKKNIEKILNLYIKWGSSDYIGEDITQIEHALQCAELAATDYRLNIYDDFIRNCVIVAALLHDIGHLVGLEEEELEMRIDNGTSLGIVGHEGIGSAFLKDIGMPSLVCELVRGHVAAKRYLCTKRPGYWEKLSPASQETMKLQGGMMSESELKQFKSGIMPELKIFIREYDDAGKKKDLNLSSSTDLIGLARYKNEIEKALMHGRLFV
jgi:predicted HD phosphohydrolase